MKGFFKCSILFKLPYIKGVNVAIFEHLSQATRYIFLVTINKIKTQLFLLYYTYNTKFIK